MTTKTAYRVVDYKGVQYLHYLKLYKFWFVKWYEWETISYPNEHGKPQVVCNKIQDYRSIRKFVIKYPDIAEYFKTEYVERKNKFKNGHNK